MGKTEKKNAYLFFFYYIFKYSIIDNACEVNLNMRKHTISFFLAVLMVLSIMPVGTMGGTQAQPVVRIQVDRYTANDVLQLVELSVDINQPIIVYTNPEKIELVKKQETRSLDITTLELATTGIALEYIDGYTQQFTSIRPDNHIRSFIYVTDDSDLSAFEEELEAEYNLLKETTTATKDNSFVIASYSGDSAAYNKHWLWDVERLLKISAVDDGNGWTAETTYEQMIWRSNYDYDTSSIWWATEWTISSKIDPNDYKSANIDSWTGPWVSQRYLKADMDDEELSDWGPTTSTGSTSYSIGATLDIGTDSAGVSFGLSSSWTVDDVSITDQTSDYNNYVQWNENFRGPDYAWWPILTSPCSAAHNTFISYRGALWYAGKYNDLDFTLNYNTHVTYDHDYKFYLLVLQYTRTTYYISGSLSFSFDSGYEPPSGGGGGGGGTPVIV